MLKLLYVGAGGFLGAALRYSVGGWLVRIKGGTLFPWETLVVNVAGCLAIGALAALSETRGVFGGTTRAFLFVGVLGGFTTFSTFGYETFQLLRDGQHTAAAMSALLQVGCGLGAVWAGDALARALWG
jgi:CrcB protein